MKKTVSPAEREGLLVTLHKRFERNTRRHVGIKWDQVLRKLEADEEKLWSLYEMEKTGGEPDVVWYDESNDQFIFCDCSAESPKGRRSLCYDRESWEARKTFRPKQSALEMADEMGIDILDEEWYRKLQESGEFDTKTSSWIKTPENVRKLGGAIFADRRFNRVFTYHNGASSYYAARGFRGLLRV